MKTMIEMKTKFKNIWLFIIPALVIGALISSCNEEESAGDPSIAYIRVTDPASSDSLLVSAFLGNTIAIRGENLQNVREVWFNDQQASLNPVYITSSTIITDVPNKAPVEITDVLKLVMSNGSTYDHAFVVSIPAPEIYSMSNEHAADGGSASIYGQYFFDPVPIVVQFPASGGGIVEAEIVEVADDQLDIIIPNGAVEGTITVITNFGEAESTLHFRDSRNIFLNWDDLNADGSWRPGIYINDEHSIDGNYMRFRGTYSASAPRVEGPDGDDIYTSQFWGQANGRPEGNLLPGEPEDYVLKFEAKVIDWYASYLNICFSPWDNNGNQEVWSNTFNARAIWGPWDVENAPYDTDGEWRTFTIPITDFMWAMDMPGDNVEYTEMKFDKNVTGGMSFWMLGAPMADNSPFEVYIDNVRIVEK